MLVTVFSSCPKANFTFSVIFILLSANGFNLDQSNNFSFGKELICPLQMLSVCPGQKCVLWLRVKKLCYRNARNFLKGVMLNCSHSGKHQKPFSLNISQSTLYYKLIKDQAACFVLYGSVFTNHSQEHSLSFSPRFANWNVTQLLSG